METKEIRLRLIEAAARAPAAAHGSKDWSTGVVETAEKWADWVDGGQTGREVLGLPKKKPVV